MSTRHLRLAAATFAAAVLATAAALASSSGGQPAAPAPAEPAVSLFRGIPERDGVLGDPAAPLTVTEYVDLQCPACASAARATLPALVRGYVRTGKVRLDVRILHFLGPDSERAAFFAAGAAEQGRLWPFLEAFYAAQGDENSGYVTGEFLDAVADAAGVDADAAREVARGEAAQERLNRANADAEKLGVASTPTFTIARGAGQARVLPAGAQDPAGLAAALDAELER